MKKEQFNCNSTYFLGLSAQAQDKFPKGYFASPLDIPLVLSGNFGELRGNHFHSGIDIKTGGTEGKKVYAPADGYVSRIKISATGYGHALYINHPNGYTTVYGHLKSYNDAIGAYAKKAQYEKESFEVELFPPADALPVKKGEVIALSGNTGGSGGPHLHFEIRRTSDEHPLNVLEFGLDITDLIPPSIDGVMVYPIGNSGHVNHSTKPTFYKSTGTNGKYKLPNPVECSGLVAFGIDAFDMLNGAANHNGVYSIELYANAKRIFRSQVDEFSFDDTRFINAHIDYSHKLKGKQTVQKSFLTAYNKLPFYSSLINYGMVTVLPDTNINMEYVVKDVYGNTSYLPFTLKGVKSRNYISVDSTATKFVKKMPHYKSNFYVTDDIEVRFPEYSFYDDLNFEFEKLPARQGTYGPVYRVHDIYTPVHRYYSLSIVLKDVPAGLEDKLLIVSYDLRGQPVAEGGTLRGNKITTKTRSFGEYTVMADSSAPVIKPINISDGKNIAGNESISMRTSDDLSGIASYRGTINDKWILMEYDPKSNTLSYTIDKNTPKGELNFQLTVTDERGNSNTYKAKVTR